MPVAPPADKVSVSPAAFPAAQPGERIAAPAALSRFFDVRLRITAELGRVQLSLGELLELGPGSLLELDRSVTAPLDVYAQGVRIAAGEVVVVHDRYGIRITELDSQGLSPTEQLAAGNHPVSKTP